MSSSEIGDWPEFGAIFIANRRSAKECFDRRIFGLPLSFEGFVSEVRAGMVLFLFEYEERKLHGVFRASSDGAMDILPLACASSGKRYPAQLWDCEPLHERVSRDAIRDNYFKRFKFHLGLCQEQVSKLLWLFNSRRTKAITSRDSSSKRSRGEDAEKESSALRRKLSFGKYFLTRERSKTSQIDETFKSENSMKLFECGSGSNSFGNGNEASPFEKGLVQLRPLDDSDHSRAVSANLGDLVQLGSLKSSEKLEDPSNAVRIDLGDSSQVGSIESSEKWEDPLKAVDTNLGDLIQLVSTDLGAVEKAQEPSEADITTELGDFIPLPSSPDNDDNEESPGCHDQIPFIPVESCVPLKLLCCNSLQQDDNNQKSSDSPQQDDSDKKAKVNALDNKAAQLCTKRLYSDKQGRSSVFSRLNFGSKKDEETKSSLGTLKSTVFSRVGRETIADAKLCHEWRNAAKRFEFFMDTEPIRNDTVEDIMETLAQRNRTWSEQGVTELGAKKRNIFSRLSWGSPPSLSVHRNENEFVAGYNRVSDHHYQRNMS